MLSLAPKRTMNKLPKSSQAAATSPMEAGKPERLLLNQVTPPLVLYLVTSAQVSLTNRLSGLSGLITIISSTLLPETLLALMLGPTVIVAARPSCQLARI